MSLFIFCLFLFIFITTSFPLPIPSSFDALNIFFRYLFLSFQLHLDFFFNRFNLLINLNLFPFQLFNFSLFFSNFLLLISFVFLWLQSLSLSYRWLVLSAGSLWLWWVRRWWWARRWGWAWRGRWWWGRWLSSLYFLLLPSTSSSLRWLGLSPSSILFFLLLNFTLQLLSLFLDSLSFLLLFLHQPQHFLLLLHLLQHHLLLFLLPPTHNNFLLHLQNLSHIFCQWPQSYRCKIIDWKSQIVRMIYREQTLIIFAHLLLVELLLHSFYTEILCYFLE